MGICFQRGLKIIYHKFKRAFVNTKYPQITSSSLFDTSVNIYSPENLIMEEQTSIGPNSTIMNSRAKFIMKKYSFSGPQLLVITGNHMPIIGIPLIAVSDSHKDMIDKNHEYDKNIIVDEDVWIGARVTLLNGVHISRGTIIAAGSVVVKDTLPYSIVGGCPARTIKQRWTNEEIIQHESKVYSPCERLTIEQLEKIWQEHTKK